MKDGDVIQVAHVVRDIDQAMKRYWDTFGLGPWSVYQFKPPEVRESMVHGRPSDFTYLVAVTDFRGGVQLELMQPLTGRSIYDEHLERKGEGLHHVKLYYADCQAALARYRALGIQVIQSGKYDEDEFYFLDTERDFGSVIEVGNAGKLRAPWRRYPA
jgi:4-hydroxyphenylpyruvate dioxygenase-like putative hemolysin